jgi:transposase
MANYLKMDKVQIILGLLKLKWSYRHIQRFTGIDRKTIAKHDPARAKSTNVPTGGETPLLQNPPNCPPAPLDFHPDIASQGEEGAPSRIVITNSAERPSRSHAAPFHELIATKLATRLDAQRIFQDLRSEHDYLGSYDSVKRYIRHLRGVDPEVFARIESAPGEEAQIDFGQGAPTLKDGRYRRPWLFKMTLSFSRHSYEEVVWRQDVQPFLRCHENAFADFSGAPRILKIDNLKSGILDANLFEPIVHPLYAAFAQHYGCVVLPCKVGRPEHKGKVEAGVKYTQNNALKGRRFESLGEQNAFLRHWNQTWARQRIHGTTKKQVWQLFHDGERQHLLPLPAEAFQFFEVVERSVHIDGHIEVKGAYYSVPHRYLGIRVTVHFNRQWLKVYHRGEVIAFHAVGDKGRFTTVPDHLPEYKALSQQQYTARLLQRCQAIGPNCHAWAQKSLTAREPLALRAMQGVLALKRTFSPAKIEQACAQALQVDSMRYKTIKRLCEAPEPSTQLSLLQEHELIRPPEVYEQLIRQKVDEL